MITEQNFQGFFDSDGGIQINLIRVKQKSNKIFNCSILFTFTQSLANKNMLEQLKEEFGGCLFIKTRKTGTKEVVYKNYITSKAGQKMLICLKKYAPLNPSKRHDFLIACHIFNCLKKKVHYTYQGQSYLIFLIYKMSNQIKHSSIIKRKPINDWLIQFNMNQSELLVSERKAENFLNLFVKLNTTALVKSLPKTKLNPEYLRGVHCGDGSLTVFLCWNPEKQFITRPCWSVTDSNKQYLKAFLFTFQQGRIKHVGPKKGKCFQYVIENVNPCLKLVLPMFKDNWLPKSKKRQFNKFKQACYMLKCNFLYTEKGARIFLNLVYDMSSNPKRKVTKKQLRLWILKRLKTARPLKPKIELYKKLINM